MKPGEQVGGVNFTSPKTGDGRKGSVRDAVGAAVGMSGPSYDRAKDVVIAAERDDLSPEDQEMVGAGEARERDRLRDCKQSPVGTV